MSRFKIEDYELVETFEPIRKAIGRPQGGVSDRSRTRAAKQATIARKRQRKAKVSAT